MQAETTPRGRTNAIVGAVIVAIVAIALAVVFSLAQGGSQDSGSTWPVDIRSTVTEPNVPADVEFRAGERQMLPAEQDVLEAKALLEFRQSERASR
jgi:hypothetical protein